MNRVVITGAGCVTPVGNNLEAFSQNLRDGICTAGPITKFDTNRFPVTRACEIRNYKPPPASSVLDPFIQYGLSAVIEALSDSRLDLKQMDPYRVGIAVSTSKGGMTTLERFRTRFLKKPSALLAARVYANLIPNILSQWIARRWKLHGPAKPVVAACATGLYAMMEGIRMIEDDEADVCIAGASDAPITPFILAGYSQMGVFASEGMYPFDRRRNGFLIGEGAGIVILEKESHAKARGASIYGTVLGYAYGFESAHPISFPAGGDGLAQCLTRMLQKAKIPPREINSLQLHGTATRNGDLYETVQVKAALGRDAGRISMSAIKSMIGHAIGASGALSLIANLISLRDQFIPPTVNLNSPDPECDLDYTPNQAKEKTIQTAGSIAMGFGGHVGAVLVGK